MKKIRRVDVNVTQWLKPNLPKQETWFCSSGSKLEQLLDVCKENNFSTSVNLTTFCQVVSIYYTKEMCHSTVYGTGGLS